MANSSIAKKDTAAPEISTMSVVAPAIGVAHSGRRAPDSKTLDPRLIADGVHQRDVHYWIDDEWTRLPA